eukprot:gnl/Spiro4/2746_TR1334_c0_g1_i1.p1 gnl/Spiro4/2746_TR1334_c0_g1~~gnl/Spiro4/2746_TR1334_c0_g1_i1.p1  ORF type:complete len:439 (+),score=136.47 gnl/Spiro4/2746_TR1334_c0_g1_i1:47-1363(+)
MSLFARAFAALPRSVDLLVSRMTTAAPRGKKSIADLAQGQLTGKLAFVRVDFNVPLDKSLHITEDLRIRSALPTINYLKGAGARVVLCSHLGDPKAEDPALSLKPVAAHLSTLLNTAVPLVPLPQMDAARKSSMKNGEIALLENIRFFKAEKKNDAEFSKQLAANVAVYVNDAFGTAHRAHSSTAGMASFVNGPKVAGFLMEAELRYLQQAVLDHPEHPLAAIIGGSKISSKLPILNSLLSRCDRLLIGGAMANTFLAAQGMKMGSSLTEPDMFGTALQLLAQAKASGKMIVLPTDLLCFNKTTKEFRTIAVPLDMNAAATNPSLAVPEGFSAMDIGVASTGNFVKKLETCRTIVWNGPVGAFEVEGCSQGTRAVAECMAALTKKGVTTVIGGGDSTAAVNQYGLSDDMTHVSTGGGACLELLEGKELPGVACLDNRA